MNRILFIIGIILLLACNNRVKKSDLDGNWIILEMTYQGEYVYPKSNQGFTITVTGFEGSEKINFSESNSLVAFPGFNSAPLLSYFDLVDNRLILSIDKEFVSENVQETYEIFNQEYDIKKSTHKGILYLNSANTKIKLYSEDEAYRQRFKQFTNQF